MSTNGPYKYLNGLIIEVFFFLNLFYDSKSDKENIKTFSDHFELKILKI